MEPGTLVIASAANEKYAIGLGVMMCSALLCSPHKEVRFYIIDDGITPGTRQLLLNRVHSVAERRGLETEIHFIGFAQFTLPELPPYFGAMTSYGRMFLPDVIAEPSLFYVDADILCNRRFPLSKDLFRNHQDALLVGCQDMGRTLRDECPWQDRLNDEDLSLPYVNTGFLWMNLEGLRKFQLMERFSELVREGKPLPFADQTALNFLCRRQIGLLPNSFNRLLGKKPDLNDFDLQSNFHFVGPVKPWFNKERLSTFFSVAFFWTAARSFGFASDRGIPANLNRTPMACYLKFKVRKPVYQFLKRKKRLGECEVLKTKSQLLKSLLPAYAAHLHSLLGTPVATPSPDAMPGGVP